MVRRVSLVASRSQPRRCPRAGSGNLWLCRRSRSVRYSTSQNSIWFLVEDSRCGCPARWLIGAVGPSSTGCGQSLIWFRGLSGGFLVADNLHRLRAHIQPFRVRRYRHPVSLIKISDCGIVGIVKRVPGFAELVGLPVLLNNHFVLFHGDSTGCPKPQRFRAERVYGVGSLVA